MTGNQDNVVRMKAADDLMRKAFLGWQCRLRQLCMRDDEGRPGPGMRPALQVAGQDAGKISVVMIRNDCETGTAEFQHIVKRTHDPKERFEAALRYFQSSYFQDPTSFDGEMTAVFAMSAALPKQIAGRSDCLLTFSQFNQVYELTCEAELLASDDRRFQATYWHNKLFNPSMPAGVQVLCFRPDWAKAKAEPAPF